VFKASGQVVGVGHASFVKSPDGTENWIVYHAHKNPLPPSGEIRDVRMQPFTFLADGTPNFGVPQPDGLLPVPSVGPDAQRMHILGDYNADGFVTSPDRATWQATFGALVFPGSGADGNGNAVVDAADYVIWRRNRSDTLAQSAATAIPPTPQPAATPKREEPGAAISPSADVQRRHDARRSMLVPSVVDPALQHWSAAVVWYGRSHARRIESIDRTSYPRKNDDNGNDDFMQWVPPFAFVDSSFWTGAVRLPLPLGEGWEVAISEELSSLESASTDKLVQNRE
jgi:hypothetical protein